MTNDVRPRVREILAAHAQLGTDARALATHADLYDAGMTSRASVNVMLALEGEFGVEFPDAMLKRSVFVSIDSISEAIEGLLQDA